MFQGKSRYRHTTWDSQPLGFRKLSRSLSFSRRAIFKACQNEGTSARHSGSTAVIATSSRTESTKTQVANRNNQGVPPRNSTNRPGPISAEEAFETHV